MDQRHTRTNNAARWTKAAERAIGEGVQVRQLVGSGQWIATSGSDGAVAYEVEVTGNVAHGCGCLAGLNGDPVCKHRAAYYLLIGALDLNPEPEPPAPAAAADCAACRGCGVLYDRNLERAGWLYPACAACGGSGAATTPAIIAASARQYAEAGVMPATKRGVSLVIALDYCLIRPTDDGERVIEGECMVEVEYDGVQWRSAAKHSAEGDWSEVIRFAYGEAGDRADPLALLSGVTGKRFHAM